MEPRLNWFAASPLTKNAAQELGARLRESRLEKRLGELIRIRVSQMNGCAWCLHMHLTDARALGESDLRLHMLAGWRESPLFDDKERAALAWTESLTRLGPDAASDAEWEAMRAHFDDDEIVELTLLAGAMNLYNRINLAFRMPHPMTEADRAEVAGKARDAA